MRREGRANGRPRTLTAFLACSLGGAAAALLWAAPVAAQTQTEADAVGVPVASRSPGMSSLRSSDRLGRLIWQDPNEDAIPELRFGRSRGPDLGGIHMTTTPAEQVIEWLREWGAVQTGAGPNSRR